MGKKPAKWLPGERVDETILLQRKTVEQLKADRLIKRKSEGAELQRERAKKRLDIKKARKLSTRRFVSAQAILHTAEKRVKNARRYAKAGEKFDARAVIRADTAPQTYKNARVALIIRSKGKMLPQEVKAGFKSLGLEKLYQAKLLLLTPEIHKLLLQLRHFASVGYPTRDQLEQLLRSRGSLWTSSTAGGVFRAQLTGNMIVEQNLAKDFNVYTIEELADAVFSKVKKVALIIQKIAPFDLHPPRQLFFERNRSVHEKLEVLNAESFANLLAHSLDKKPINRKGEKKALIQKEKAASNVNSAKRKASYSTKVAKISGARRQRDEK